MKTKIISSLFSALLLLALAVPGSAIAGGGAGANKLEGAWIATVNGFPGQWSYVLTADASGRHASGHGSIEVGFVVAELGPYDEVSPFLVNVEMTGPASAVYNSIWYGLREVPPPSIVSHEIVWIGTSQGTFEYIAPDKKIVVNNFAFYLADQDADGDGLPDEDATPVYTLQLETTDTRFPSP
jgi:hypothetical protein